MIAKFSGYRGQAGSLNGRRESGERQWEIVGTASSKGHDYLRNVNPVIPELQIFQEVRISGVVFY